MKLSRNALRNLANRYRAVLKKCRLLNTFGILLLAGCCVVGRGGAVSAEPLYGQKETSQNASVTGGTVSTDQGASGAFGGYSYYYESWPWGSYSNSATGNSVTITGGTYTSERTEAGDNIAVAGGYANRNADGNSVTITGGNFNGGDIYGGAVTDQKGFADRGSADNNSVSLHDATGRVDFIAGGYANTDSRDEKGASASGNAVTVGSGITVGGKSFLINGKEENVSVAGGFATTEANGNSVTISGGTFNGSVFGGIAISKGGVAEDNTVAINGGEINGDVYGSYIHSGTSVSGAVTISGDAVINGHVYAAGIQNPAGAHLSGTMTITGTADLSNAAIHGYTGNEQASASRDFRLDITGYNGTVGTIDTFNQIYVSSSSLKAGTINGDMYNGSSWTGQTSITVDGSSVVAGEIVNFASLTLNDSSLEADKISGWNHPVYVDGFETYKIDATNTNIKIYDTLTEYDTLNITNSIKNNVSINKIHGNDDSTTNIKSGTVEIYDSIHVTGGEFRVNDTDAESSFVTRMGGDIIAKDSSLGGAAVSVSFNTASSFFNGHTELQGTDSSIDLAFTGGAAWNMTGNSTLSSLTLDGDATVDLTTGRQGKTDAFRTLTVDSLAGDGGLFTVGASLADGHADQVVINDAAGAHRLFVLSSGTEPGVAATDFIVRKQQGTGTFSLANEGGKVDAGLYLYELASRDLGSTGNPDGREWYLQRSAGGEKSPTGETVLGLSGMASAYAMYMGQLSDLRERLGEIRHGTGTDGLWVRGFTQENTLSGLGGIDFSQNFYGTSFGYDRLVEQNENNKWLFGVRGQLTKADQRIDGLHDGSGDSRSYGLAAYATWQHGDGWYADTVLSWDWYDQDLKTRMLDGTRVHGSYNTYGGGISQEFGRMFRFDDGFFVEPQLQLSWYWMKGTDFTTSNGMKVEQDDAYALTGRAGLVLGKKWDLDEGRYFQPYIKGGVNHEFAGDQKVTVNDIAFSDDLRGTRIYYGAGFDVQFASNARFYAEFEREDGQKASTPWSVSAGLRVEF